MGAAFAALMAAGAEAAPTYIRAGRLIDVPGKGVRGPSTIVVENGRIVAVTDGQIRVEPGATYEAFRGRAARIESMLEKKGLLQPS